MYDLLRSLASVQCPIFSLHARGSTARGYDEPRGEAVGESDCKEMIQSPSSPSVSGSLWRGEK